MKNKNSKQYRKFLVFGIVFLCLVGFVSALDITVYSPSDGDFLDTSSVLIESQVNALAGHIIYCDINTNLTGVMNTTVKGALVGTSVLSPIAVGSFPDGFYQWNMNCTDTTDSSINDTALSTFYVDTTTPNVTLSSPLDNYILTNGNTTSLIGNINEDNLDSCTLYTNFSGTWEASSLTNQVAYPNFMYNTPELSDDVYQWNVFCNDSAGNSAISASNYVFEIDLVNDQPFFYLEPQTVARGIPFSVSLNATDSNDYDSLSYTSSSVNYTIDAAGLISNTNPQNSELVNFTVCDNSGASNACYNDTIQFTIRTPQTSLSLTSLNFPEDLDREKNYTTTLYLENTGDYEITDISMYTGFDLKYEPVISNIPVTLPVGAKVPVTLQIYIPLAQDSDETELGSIYVQSGNSLLDESFMKIDVINELKISNLEFKVTGRDVYDNLDNSNLDELDISPGDSVKLDFNVENSFSSKQDIRMKSITATLSVDKFASEDGDDLEHEFSTFSLDAREDKDLEFEFKAPYVLEDNNKYSIVLKVEAKDEEGKDHAFKWEGVFVGERSDDKTKIVSYSLSEQRIECLKKNYPLQFNAKIQNIGYKKQENMYAELYLPKLNLNKTFKFGLVPDPTEDNNSYDIDEIFYIPKNTTAGKYYLNLDLYSDFSHVEDKLVLSFEVRDCPITKPTTPITPKEDNTKEDTTPTTPVKPKNDEITQKIDSSYVSPDDILALRTIFGNPDLSETNYNFTKKLIANTTYQASLSRMKAIFENDDFDFTNESKDVFNKMLSEVGNGTQYPLELQKALTVYKLNDKFENKNLEFSEFSISFNSTENIKEISLLDIIPKNIIKNASLIYFVDDMPTIVQDDPVVMWTLKNIKANETYTVKYYVKEDVNRLSTQTLNMAKTTPNNLFIIGEYFPMIGLIFGGLFLLALVGFLTVFGLNKLFSDISKEYVAEEVATEDDSEYLARAYDRNPYLSGERVEGYRKTKHISLPGLPPLEAEIDQVNGKVQTPLEF